LTIVIKLTIISTHSLNNKSCQDLLATQILPEDTRIPKPILTSKVNDKLCVILRVIKPAFDPRTKLRCDEKVSDRRQVNDGILKVIRVYSNYLIIRDVVVKNGTELIRHSESRKRLSESYTKCRESER
jgi:hypothetical protein